MSEAPVELARGSRRIGGFTMLSRVLGLVREQLFLATLGTGAGDAFVAAFRIPNLLRDLFAEGALSQSFVPTYIATKKGESREAGFALAQRVLTTVSLYLAAVALLVALAPALVSPLVGGFSSEKRALFETLLRVMMPFLPLISAAVVAMGVLNAEERYTAPALAPSLFNVVAIAGGVVVWTYGWAPAKGALVWAALTLVGGAAQLAIQVPPLRALGFRFRFRPDLALRDPGTRRIASQMAPATLAVAAVQVNVLVNTVFASSIEGGNTWLYGAFRFMQLPLGVFGVAVATVATTKLAHDAHARDGTAFGITAQRGLRLVLFLTVPSMVGLVLVGLPIMRLVYEHGRIHATDSAALAAALSAYAVGLPAYAAVKVIVPAYYATSHPRVPLAASVLAVAANVLWNVLTFRRLGHVGLAFGTSIAAWLNVAVLALAFRRTGGGLFSRELADGLGRVTLAAGIMGAAVWGVLQALAGTPRPVVALVPVVVGAVAYFAAAHLLRLPEAAQMLAFRRRR